VKSNVEGSNQSLLVNSCRDGTEVSQYSGCKLLHMFVVLGDSSDPASVLEQRQPEDSYDILPNPAALSSIRVTLNRSIKLESKDGDFALAISPDGRLVAGGSSDIEVFDVETGNRLWKFSCLPLEEDEIHGASFSHDASRLAAGGERGNIYVSSPGRCERHTIY
jgi:WD40 repeat protein